MAKRRTSLAQKAKEVTLNEEIQVLLDEFSTMYSLQKKVDLDDIELVCYEDKKRVIFYFRIKRKELKIYGTEIIQT